MSEIEELRAEVAALREEVASLRKGLYGDPRPLPVLMPYVPPTGAPQPLYPGGPIPAWCGHVV